MALNRLADAHTVHQRAQARKLEFGEIARARYRLAFLEGDKEMMTRAVLRWKASLVTKSRRCWRNGKRKRTSDTLGAPWNYLGSLKTFASGKGDKATSADIEERAAFLEALFGNSAQHAVMRPFA